MNSVLRMLLLLALIFPPGSGVLHADKLSGYVLKSAFIYNFVAFTKWPDGSPNITICVKGDQVYSRLLNSILAKKPPQDRKILVVNASTISDLVSCAVLVLSRSGLHAQQMNDIDTTSMLIVSDESTEVDLAMITLVEKNDRISFFINKDNLERSDIKVSSKLLRLSQGYR